MGKTKRKPKQRLTKRQPPATEIQAENSLPAEARQHASYAVERFAMRDAEGSASNALDGHRMRRVACAKALEGLVVKQPRSEEPFLTPVQAQAASVYQGDLDACHGGQSHEINERVQMSGSPDLAQCYQLDCLNRVARIGHRMHPDQNKAVRTVIENREMSLSALWPERTAQRRAKELIRDGLDWLAQEYGLIA